MIHTTPPEEIAAEKAAKLRYDLIPVASWPRMAYATEARNVAASVGWGRREALRTLICMIRGTIRGHADYADADDDAAATVMAYGRAKHGRSTYRVAGSEQSRPETHWASCVRHLVEHHRDPKAVESGSGYPVLWHALAQALITLDLLVCPVEGPDGEHDGRGML